MCFLELPKTIPILQLKISPLEMSNHGKGLSPPCAPVARPEQWLHPSAVLQLCFLTSEEVHAAGEQGPRQEAAKRPRHAKPAGPPKLVLDAQEDVVEEQRGALHVDIHRVPHGARDARDTCRVGQRDHTQNHEGSNLQIELLSAGWEDLPGTAGQPLHAQPLEDSPWLLVISCAARQRLHLMAWHSHTPPAHWQHSGFCSKRQKAPPLSAACKVVSRI